MSDRGDMPVVKSKPTNMDKTTESRLVEKRNQVAVKLMNRDNERLAEIEKRKADKDSVSAVNENSNLFSINFSRAKEEIETHLDASMSVSKSLLAAHFDSMHTQLQTMQKFVTDSTLFLPRYDLEKAQETVNKLQSLIQSNRAALIPQKQFSFGSKNRKHAPKPSKAVKPQPVNIRKAVNTDIGIAECCISDLEEQELVKYAEDINEKDVALSNLDHCTVRLIGSPGALHMIKLQDCKVFSGPVSGAIFIDECNNCTFVLACQQLRVHKTLDSHVYLHVTSRAIIEDCRNVEFAPNTWSYKERSRDYVTAGLDQSINTWDDVDDFNWLASDTPSPNWSILPDNERLVFNDIPPAKVLDVI